MACTYLGPTVLALYWRRTTRAGAVASLVSGFLTVLLFWCLGYAGIGKEGLTGPAAERFAPLYLFGLDPLVYGLVVSFVLESSSAYAPYRLPEKQVDHYFLANERSP